SPGRLRSTRHTVTTHTATIANASCPATAASESRRWVRHKPTHTHALPSAGTPDKHSNRRRSECNRVCRWFSRSPVSRSGRYQEGQHGTPPARRLLLLQSKWSCTDSCARRSPSAAEAAKILPDPETWEPPSQFPPG